jgi:chemotaxis protein MotB
MARKAKHEDHMNHEAWAIPYGDLITLLLAFFVVMYSMSSVNEGKYRVLADSLNAAFKGTPRTPRPISVGPKENGSIDSIRPKMLPGAPPPLPKVASPAGVNFPGVGGFAAGRHATLSVEAARERAQLQKIGDEVHAALGDLIARDLVVVRRHETWLEVEMQTDILFPSGSAELSRSALPILARLADVLDAFDNRLRIEGHTDDRPIATREFPSNWELSSARAASVVHRFMSQGIDPRRMTVLGLAEYQPVADNASIEGRNRNRRVVIVVLAQAGDSVREHLPVAGEPAGPGTPDLERAQP